MAEWRGLLNSIQYLLIFTPEPGPADADRVVDELIGSPSRDAAADRAGIEAALASSEPLAGPIAEHLSDADLRAFLRLVLDRMDARRPWPVHRYRPVWDGPWPDLAAAVPVARFRVGFHDLQGRLRAVFRSLPGDPGRGAILLELRPSGEPLAVLIDFGTAAEPTLVVPPGGPPVADAVPAFCAATGFRPDELTAR